MNVEDLQLKFNNKKKTKNPKLEMDFVTPLLSSLNVNERPGVIYSRVSTNMQYEKGFSLDHQDHVLTEYCKKNNIHIVGKYVEAVSGGSMNRPELQKMLASLRPGYAVVCNAVSRLSRNLDDLLHIVRLIKQAKSTLILLDMAVDTSTTNGRFMLSVMGMMSEMERANISERVSNVMQHLKSEGRLICKPHYGWKYEDGVLIEKEDEQAVIEMIRLTLKNEPDINSSKIVRVLNQKGFTNRKDKKFHTTTVESIIKYNNIPYIHFKTESIKPPIKAQPKSVVDKEPVVDKEHVIDKEHVENGLLTPVENELTTPIQHLKVQEPIQTYQQFQEPMHLSTPYQSQRIQEPIQYYHQPQYPQHKDYQNYHNTTYNHGYNQGYNQNYNQPYYQANYQNYPTQNYTNQNYQNYQNF